LRIVAISVDVCMPQSIRSGHVVQKRCCCSCTCPAGMHIKTITSQGKPVHRMDVELRCLLRREQKRGFAAPHNAGFGTHCPPCCCEPLCECRHDANVVRARGAAPPQSKNSSIRIVLKLMRQPSRESCDSQAANGMSGGCTEGAGWAGVQKGSSGQLDRCRAFPTVHMNTAASKTGAAKLTAITVAASDAVLHVLKPAVPPVPRQSVLQTSG
jgi:hypothetical protein